MSPRHLPLLLSLLLLGACAGPAPRGGTPSSDDLVIEDQATVQPSEDQETVESEPSLDPEARFEAALTLMRQGKNQEAESEFSALAKDHPEFSGPHTNLGILFANSNRRDAAIVSFTKAAQANAQNAVAFNWLGILNRESGNYERARQSFEKAIEADPDYAAPHINLGLLLERHLQQPEQAVIAYRRYREVAGESDLRVLPWIAELELVNPAAATEAEQ